MCSRCHERAFVPFVSGAEAIAPATLASRQALTLILFPHESLIHFGGFYYHLCYPNSEHAPPPSKCWLNIYRLQTTKIDNLPSKSNWSSIEFLTSVKYSTNLSVFHLPNYALFL